jgi:polygalacturonase
MKKTRRRCINTIVLPLVILLAFVVALPPVRAAAAKTFAAANCGIIGDGVTLNTIAIQKVVDVCSAQGGGTIQFSAGRYVTGTIQLKDNVTLHFDAQAVLLGSTNAADYRNVDPFTAGDGVPLGYALIVADGAKNVGVEGAGTIDGQGRSLKAAQSRYTVRPFLMRWLRCTNVTVKDVHLANPGAWTLNFFQTRTASIERVTIRSRTTGLVNNDGIDLDSCEAVRIRDCDIESGDDAICLKTTSALPCRDISVTGCKLSTRCNAIKLGTESLGDFENISVANCQLRDIGMAGIALYCVDGAQMHDVTISDLTMAGVNVPVSVRLGARLKIFRAGDIAKPVGTLRDITIKNIQAKNVGRIGLLINGIPGHPVENLNLENIQIELPGGGTSEDAQIQLPEKESAYPEYSMFGKVLPAAGIYARHVRGVSFKNMRTTRRQPDARPAAVFIDVANVTPANFANTIPL